MLRINALLITNKMVLILFSGRRNKDGSMGVFFLEGIFFESNGNILYAL